MGMFKITPAVPIDKIKQCGSKPINKGRCRYCGCDWRLVSIWCDGLHYWVRCDCGAMGNCATGQVEALYNWFHDIELTPWQRYRFVLWLVVPLVLLVLGFAFCTCERS
jgi:hypothetical protein